MDALKKGDFRHFDNMKIQEAEKNGASLHLKVYAESPESGVMRAPEDVDVLCVTGDAFKRKSITFLMSIELLMMILMKAGTCFIVLF